MKIQTNLLRFGGVALAAVLVSLSATTASATLTTYSPGDIFIGFRQTGVANTVVAKIGTVGDYLPASLGGPRALGSTYNPTFGVIPNTSTLVTNLSLDLNTVFGSSWANNPTDGSGVRWGVVGWTGNTGETSSVSGLTVRSLFVTRGRTEPSTPTSVSSTISSIGDRSGFATAFTSFAYGSGQGSYVSQDSTANSSVAYIGAASGANNWGTQIQANAGFGLGSGRAVDQTPLTGAYSGPTSSVLDLWLSPNTGSTLASTNTYLGSFALNNSGSLTFTAVPEPGTYILLAIVGLFFVVFRRRKNSFN